MRDTFDARRTLAVGGRELNFASLEALDRQGLAMNRLPYSLKILLENLLRREDGEVVSAADIEAVAKWDPLAEPSFEIAFMPARVLLQDFTGVPAVVDLAAMRDAMVSMGGDPRKINPLQPVELVIDHSVQVDEYGSAAALLINAEKEFERNHERYVFLRWGQRAFDNFRVVPPATGIVHQVNLEYLARVVMVGEGDFAYPDTLVGTDSHTTMINGLGVLGWGVGGIEAEAAMLGQPISMLLPQVVGFRLRGKLAEGATATDLVLRVTELLRKRGVVGKFVEFFGPGLASLPLADRATIANMAPEYGATCGIFPVDEKSLEYLRFSGRPDETVELAEAYMKAQGLFHGPDTPEAQYSDVLELDLATVEPSLAGPRRPQDRVPLSAVHTSFRQQLESLKAVKKAPVRTGLPVVGAGGGVAVAEAPAMVGTSTVEASAVGASLGGEDFQLDHGSVVIAAITSCTNTSNPSVMLAAGLLAKKANERGLKVKPWVKTSLAPGSKVVTRYLQQAGVLDDLEALKFNVVGYGCTTCIGNSGPLPEAISKAVNDGALVAAAVLSGNRNFEGRINPDVRANYLASPPLVVAYAIAGRIDIDMHAEPLGRAADGQPVFLRDIWPSSQEIEDTVRLALKAEMFRTEYADVFKGPEQWQTLPTPEGDTFAWEGDSTYVRLPPYFVDMPRDPKAAVGLEGARVLAILGDSVTTDHISPAGSIKTKSPAGQYLLDHGVQVADFNSYGARRGNHEVMMRGTFANIRLRNALVPEIEGGFTRYLPTGEAMPIYDAAMKYREDGTPLVIFAGEEYGTGSSRDWAAKGTRLLGVRAVIAKSFERIHRSNLVGMGVLPLELPAGESAASLGIQGDEVLELSGLKEMIEAPFAAGRTLDLVITDAQGGERTIKVRVRLDTPKEVEYFRHDGILPYVLRQLL